MLRLGDKIQYHNIFDQTSRYWYWDISVGMTVNTTRLLKFLFLHSVVNVGVDVTEQFNKEIQPLSSHLHADGKSGGVL